MINSRIGVLIVEDEPGWAMLIGGYVESLGYEPIVVRSAQSAIDVLDEGVVRLIVLDMLLAVETGMALLSELRSQVDLSRIPILVCSSLPGLNLKDLSSYGVDGVIDKALTSPVDFKHEIRRLISGRE